MVHAFGDKSFAILLVVLLGVAALALPTGGFTHLLENVLVALVGVLLAAAGIAIELAVGAAAVHGISSVL